ncbi:kelch repeat and BTB domain-containing protein 3-like [Hermetia illucens]|uniref:kelch repeat and BTB domain-containing protein 3-like n=1 Tax=Hermetia illucens TaxID=343691 RepID=UPI0018CC599D|nr:kelch repeat and BTB domain-containing protein 3-like [Hermetia illucens]
MEHFEPEIAEIVTKYLHNGRINLCADTVMDIFQMAIFLQLDELSIICAGFMQDSVNLTNCIAFWKFAEFYSRHPLQIYLQRFICNSLNDVMTTTDFLELELENIKRLLSDVRLRYSEVPNRYEMIYSALMQWIRHNLIQRRPHLGSLLQLVRPEEISRDFFEEIVLDNKLMLESIAASHWLVENFNF